MFLIFLMHWMKMGSLSLSGVVELKGFCFLQTWPSQESRLIQVDSGAWTRKLGEIHLNHHVTWTFSHLSPTQGPTEIMCWCLLLNLPSDVSELPSLEPGNRIQGVWAWLKDKPKIGLHRTSCLKFLAFQQWSVKRELEEAFLGPLSRWLQKLLLKIEFRSESNCETETF